MSLQNADFARSYTETTGSGTLSGGSDDDQEISATKMLKWFSDAYRASQEWRDKVVENLKMMNNDQWPAEVLAQLPPNMAPLVINLMVMPILYLSGVERQTRQEPKIVAAGGADPRLAEIMNSLVHWVEQTNIAERTDSEVFLDKIVAGLAWWKYYVNYDCDDLEGEITLIRRPTLNIYPDPNYFDLRWSDAQFVFDTEWLTVEEAQSRWPQHSERFRTQGGEWLRTAYGGTGNVGAVSTGEDSGDTFAAERFFWDTANKRIRILECWYKELKKRDCAVNLMDPTEVYMGDEVKQIKAMLAQDPQQAQGWAVFTKPVTMVKVCHLFVDTVLDRDVTPYEENLATFPLFPAKAYYFWKEPYGLVELMKSLQWEKNKRRSKLIELVGRMPLSGFLNKEADGADQQQLENYASGNGVLINYKNTPPVPIRPPELPMAVVDLEKKADDEIRTVVNIHNELLGDATQKTISGTAIQARQRGGLLSHENLFDSFRLEKQARVQFEIGLVKQFISPSKALRILGAAATNGNQQMNQMLGAATVDPQVAQDVMTLLSDSFDIEYDVAIESRPTEASLAMESWQQLSELKQQGADIPPATLWQAAQKAGILTSSQVQEILQFAQQQQPPPGGPPPGGPPGPGGPGGSPPPTQSPGPPPSPPPQAPGPPQHQ